MANDFEGWLARDTVMDIPRMLCFIAVLFLIGKKSKELIPNLTGVKLALVFGGALLLPYLARAIFLQKIIIPADTLAIIVGNSLVVGIFEETLFRGGVFDALKEWLGFKRAIGISIVLFLLFHIQAQPLISFPQIFLVGTIFFLLRDKGVSLFWLALIHAVYDSLIFFWVPNEEQLWRMLSIEAVYFGILAVLVWKFGAKFISPCPNTADPLS